jgi:hypothetical protein
MSLIRREALKRRNDSERSEFAVNSRHYVRFEVFTAVTMKNGVSWDAKTCGSCKNRRFGGT